MVVVPTPTLSTDSVTSGAGFGFSNRNSVTSGVFIEVFAFPIRNITLILKRRASKLSCRQEQTDEEENSQSPCSDQQSYEGKRAKAESW